jgi:hypothetical protein
MAIGTSSIRHFNNVAHFRVQVIAPAHVAFRHRIVATVVGVYEVTEVDAAEPSEKFTIAAMSKDSDLDLLSPTP